MGYKYHCRRGRDSTSAIAALTALAQPTRLETFRLLARCEADGVPAGELARLMEVPQNTMSSHLGILARAGLIAGRRQSRSILCRAQLETLKKVALFLIKDCCGGRAEICAPLIADLSPSCLPAMMAPSARARRSGRPQTTIEEA
jgi:ArsR family transcriptional regulator